MFCSFTYHWKDIWMIMKITALNIYVQVLTWNSVSISLELIPRSESAGSYGTYMLNFMRNCQAMFQGDCIVFNSHQQCMRAPDVLHLCQNFVVLFPTSPFKKNGWYHIVLICIYLINYPLMCLFAIHIFFLVKCLFGSFANLFYWVVCFITVVFGERVL